MSASPSVRGEELSMIAMTFLAGIPEKDFQVTQEQVSATPFSRENFLLWLKRFNEEMKPKEDQSLPPTGGFEL